MNHEQWSGQEIAIIGMSFSLPGARSRQQFWECLREAVESVLPLSASELEAAGVPQHQINDPAFVSAMGRIPDVDFFDAHFFGYSPNEAAQIDPQQRLFLECAWEAIEDAGYDLTRWKGTTGVFAGSKVSTYAEILRNRDRDAADFSLLGNDKDFLATTVSYKLNLTGPSINVQTACSTSLVSIFLASQALLSYQCDMALAGAVSITVPQERGYFYVENGVMSPDGHCRAFDENARGAAPGNGVAVLVLKRLSDALNDRDFIHAVIRGVAINNDGGGKVGYTAPGVSGQAEVIAMAIAAAQVGPEDISYVETHGTGTPLGDTVEVAALTKAFSGTIKKQYCPIGSVKTNIGHTDTVSGAAGLIKTILALQHEMLPPSLNFAVPNSEINFAESPFYVNARLQNWKRGVTPRRAGVSSFGLGGSNAHLVVEESPLVGPGPSSLKQHVLVLSAKTPQSLDRSCESLAAFLEAEPVSSLADVAYTLGMGRKAFEWRKAIMCSDQQQAVSALRSGKLWSGRAGERRNLVFLFPGVGDHYPGMACELYETFPQFRSEIDRCCALLRPLLGRDLAGILYPNDKQDHFNNAGEGSRRSLFERSRNTAPANEIYSTLISHCIVFMVEYALARFWMSLGVKPTAMIGYSLGEYAAACISGVLSLEDALTAVVMRAKLLEQQPLGMMLAAAISAEQAAMYLRQNLNIAVINAPEMCVFAGTPEAIQDLEQRLTADFVACRILPVERPLHSPLLKDVANQYRNFLRSLSFGSPSIPYLSNVTGTWLTDEQGADPNYWAAHTTQTVLFSQGVQQLLRTPDATFLEIGPGQSLGSFVLQHSSMPDDAVVLSSVPYEHDSSGGFGFFLESVARLWLSGTEVDWARLYCNEKRGRVPLPTYQFDRQRYWIESKARSLTSYARLQKKKSVADWLYAPGWKRSPLPVQTGLSRHEQQNWLVFANQSRLCSTTLAALSDANQSVRTVIAGQNFEPQPGGYILNPAAPAAYRELVTALRQDGYLIDRVLHFWGTDENERTTEKEKNAGFYSLLWLVQAFGSSGQMEIDVVSSGTQEVVGDEMLIPERAMVLPLCRTASQEYLNMRFRHIDVTGGENQQITANLLFQEISAFKPGLRVAYRGHHRWIQDFTSLEITSTTPPIRANGTYLITGGLGNIGLTIAEYLARHYQARLVLVGPNRLPERGAWESYLREHGSSPVARKIAGLQSLEATGCEYWAPDADVADPVKMTWVLEETRARWGDIHGVIHAAGVTDTRFMRGLDETTLDDTRLHFKAKAEGARVLAQILPRYSPDFCLLMSSLSAVLGGLGMGTYAAANQYLDTLVLRESRNSQILWLSVAWDTWEVGRVPNGSLQQSALSELTMSATEGMEALMLLLSAAPLRQMVVSIGDLNTRLEEWVTRKPSHAEQHKEASAARYSRPNLATGYVEPQTELEKNLAAIWAEVLGLRQVGLQDNFFQLGGHSLLGVRVIGRVQAELGIPLHVREIFKFPTIAELSAVILEKMTSLLEQKGWHDQVEVAAIDDQSAAQLIHE